jgi:exodeoxyribonuclease V beta subunit
MDTLWGASFQSFMVPLTGMNLIEASAGTGKTTAITDLYVRLILETEWRVPHILVVTFTNAATAELRDRVRTRLVNAYDILRLENSADAFSKQFLERYTHRSQMMQRLDEAIRGFDEAAIYTIHGFCQRLLADIAFETAMPFESELRPDDREMLQDLIDDFWRREFYAASPVCVQACLDGKFDPVQLLTFMHPHVGQPYLTVVQPIGVSPQHPQQPTNPWEPDAFKVRLFEHCQQAFGEYKRRRQIQSYDDLLLNLERALDGTHGQDLAAVVRQPYPAALIDEFQDTDPVQYRIFRQVHHNTSATVFFVGDPKQAICSFRGADIFAYLKACADVDRRYTLQVNWRSDPPLIQAVNSLFQSACQPFLFNDIAFRPVNAASERRETLTEQGRELAELRVWVVSGRNVKKPATEAMAARATATEIVRLMQMGARGEARLGDRPLQGGDIAVLVRSNRLARLMQDHLLRPGVSSVQLGRENVFHAWEALELELVLCAVAEPTSDSRLRAAFATVMLGVTGEDLAALSENETLWEQRTEDFLEYHRLWQERGFARMFRTLVSRERVAQCLLGFQDGERRLTNLRHLVELLQTADARQHAGMEGLIKWLADRRQSDASQDEEEQLRLDSDEQLVKVVTIHRSKGLEYPIVFCPFLWSGRFQIRKDRPLMFHDPLDHDRALLDLCTERTPQHRGYALNEHLAEELRLLYVALTRAKHRCYLTWGSINQSATSALAWLLHQPNTWGRPLTIEALRSHVNQLTEADIQADLTHLAVQANGSVRIEPLPTAASEPYRLSAQDAPGVAARHFPWPIRQRWRITSFSALTASDATEGPDYDALTPSPSQDMAIAHPPSIVTFPRGVRAGSCLHAILQRLCFVSEDRGTIEALVKQHLGEYGYDSVWMPVVIETLERVVGTSLDRAGTLHLRDVPLNRRLDELEFTYPLTGLTCERLQHLLNAHGFAVWSIQEEIGRLAFAPASGYMKGFIDLIFEAGGRFYLTDYKSNWLGDTPEAYREEALPAVMAQHSYYLQYLIYAVALHRYLRLRLPTYDYEAQFGGVLYLFVRGMDPGLGPGYGIFRDRPARDLIEALDEYLATGSLQR